MSKTKLKDIASFSKGQQINGDQLLDDGNYEYLNGGINPSGKWSSFNVCGDTIAISEGGNSCGYVNYMAYDFWCGGHCYYLYDVKCLTKYLYYALKSQQDRIMKLRSGACMPNIKKKDLGDFVFEYNDNPVEQEKAIKLFDLFENVISYKTQQIKKLDELIKSRFVEMFGDPAINPYNWQSLKIQDAVAVKPQNGLYKPQSDYVEDNSGVPILRIDGFYNGKVVDYRNLKRLICTKEEFDKYQLVENDIVINRVNSLDYLGKCARISGIIEGTVYESNMMRMHFIDERFNPIYLTFLLCSEYTYDQIISHAKKAVNQASINQQDVLDFNIFEPPIDLQNQFADFVTQVEKQKATVQQSIDKLETLKKSLMQEYFG